MSSPGGTDPRKPRCRLINEHSPHRCVMEEGHTSGHIFGGLGPYSKDDLAEYERLRRRRQGTDQVITVTYDCGWEHTLPTTMTAMNSALRQHVLVDTLLLIADGYHDQTCGVCQPRSEGFPS